MTSSKPLGSRAVVNRMHIYFSVAPKILTDWTINTQENGSNAKNALHIPSGNNQ